MVKPRVRYVSDEILADELRRYEQQYGMSSAAFYEKYNRGEMGDSEDVIRWAAYYEWSLTPSTKPAKSRR